MRVETWKSTESTERKKVFFFSFWRSRKIIASTHTFKENSSRKRKITRLNWYSLCVPDGGWEIKKEEVYKRLLKSLLIFFLKILLIFNFFVLHQKASDFVELASTWNGITKMYHRVWVCVCWFGCCFIPSTPQSKFILPSEQDKNVCG